MTKQSTKISELVRRILKNTLDENMVLIKEQIPLGATVGWTCGAMDLAHYGTIQMWEEVASLCDVLIVGVQTDPSIDRPEKNPPVQSIDERVAAPLNSRFVDHVVVYETEADLLRLLKTYGRNYGGFIDLRVLGADHQGGAFTGDDLNMDIRFNSRTHGYSTSDLRTRVYLAEVAKRHQQRRLESVPIAAAAD